MIFRYLAKRREKMELSLSKERERSIGELEKNIRNYTARIDQLSSVQVPDYEHFSDDEVMLSYLTNLFGDEKAKPVLVAFQEARNFSTSKDFLCQIARLYKSTPLDQLREEAELAKKALERIRTSKSPSKDLLALDTYLAAERDYALGVADRGGCSTFAGEPPEKPKFLR